MDAGAAAGRVARRVEDPVKGGIAWTDAGARRVSQRTPACTPPPARVARRARAAAAPRGLGSVDPPTRGGAVPQVAQTDHSGKPSESALSQASHVRRRCSGTHPEPPPETGRCWCDSHTPAATGTKASERSGGRHPGACGRAPTEETPDGNGDDRHWLPPAVATVAPPPRPTCAAVRTRWSRLNGDGGATTNSVGRGVGRPAVHASVSAGWRGPAGSVGG